MSRKVAHPNIVWAYEVGEFRNVHYIAMEYVPGQTLSRLVQTSGPIDVSFAARLFGQVASALDHAHQQGLIHRDLKPSNILVTPRGHAKVVDFGLALMHGEAVEDHMVVGGKGYIVGTMDYIAPEQTTDAAAVGPRCDLYSLGCTMYHALSGQPPFPGGTSKEKVHRHRTEEPTPLRELRPDIPEGFASLIGWLMRKDPNERPANAVEAEKALRVWARDEEEFDEPEVIEFDEELLRDAPGLSEYSLVGLPEVEPVSEEEEAPSGQPWFLIVLAASTTILLVAALVWLLLFGRG
jgi:serine/threonine protein kinase